MYGNQMMEGSQEEGDAEGMDQEGHDHMGDSYGMEGSPGDVSPFLNILSFTLG
jgi:hypothetical protein